MFWLGEMTGYVKGNSQVSEGDEKASYHAHTHHFYAVQPLTVKPLSLFPLLTYLTFNGCPFSSH